MPSHWPRPAAVISIVSAAPGTYTLPATPTDSRAPLPSAAAQTVLGGDPRDIKRAVPRRPAPPYPQRRNRVLRRAEFEARGAQRAPAPRVRLREGGVGVQGVG